MDWNTVLIAIISSLGGAAGIIGIVKAILNFLEAKLKEPLEAKLKEWLPEKMFTALQTTYQIFTKKLTKENKIENPNWIDEALELAYQNLLDIMPKYILNIVKKLYPNIEKALKQELQNYYEKNKTRINKDLEDL